MEILIAILCLAAGAVLGVLATRLRCEAALRNALAATAVLRAELEAERYASDRREELLMGNGNLASLVAPLRDSLAEVHRQLAEVQRGRAVSDTALREQVHAMGTTSELLRTETAALVTALRAPHVRGRWGELQLERVVEAAGLTEHVDFETQHTVTDADGARLRPDLVVHLTDGKRIVVDAKVALDAYLGATEATDEQTRDLRLAAHARQLRAHVDGLADKAYWQHFEPTPEFVVCFVASDAILDAALRADPGLQEHAFGRNVVLATPSTLVALLRTVAYTWRQQSLAENAERVNELGRDLYKRLCVFGKHVDKLGRSLGGAVGSFNDAVGSLEQRVFPSARALRDLGVVGPDAATPSVTALDRTPRTLGSDELRPLPDAEQITPRRGIGR